jgi:geranylgeranyl pyrophosphate synthase
MNLYEQITVYILRLPGVDRWEGMQTLFQRVVSGKPKHWELPLKACQAVGGTLEQAIPAVTAIACSQISIILVDDMLDSDPRGEYQRIGAPAAANLACAFQAAGLQAIAYCEAGPEAKFAALNSLNQMTLTTALGQSWDVQPPTDETAYWRIVRTKSSPFFGAALQVGGLWGGASPEVAEQLNKLGCLYGEMIQIHDDLNDVLVTPANPDWLEGRSPLPILFAQSVDHPDRARFLELRQNITDPQALSEAQDILIQCGAISYGVHHLLQRHQAAQEVLKDIPLIRPDLLEALLEEVVSPVWRLFEALGESPDKSSIVKELGHLK